MSKLGVFVKLNMSRLYLTDVRSVICVAFMIETSARFCHVCRKILRCPDWMKFVSNVSPGGIAPFKSPGLSSGSVKQEAFSAGVLPAPDAPVRALLAVQPGANGTIGFVMPSDTP